MKGNKPCLGVPAAMLFLVFYDYIPFLYTHIKYFNNFKFFSFCQQSIRLITDCINLVISFSMKLCYSCRRYLTMLVTQMRHWPKGWKLSGGKCSVPCHLMGRCAWGMVLGGLGLAFKFCGLYSYCCHTPHYNFDLQVFLVIAQPARTQIPFV